jgi:hypothetical protein
MLFFRHAVFKKGLSAQDRDARNILSIDHYRKIPPSSSQNVLKKAQEAPEKAPGHEDRAPEPLLIFPL